MKNILLEILNKNFPNQNVDNALNDLCDLLQINKEQIIECPKCHADQTKQSCIGKWDNGIEYRCDDCNHEHEIIYAK